MPAPSPDDPPADAFVTHPLITPGKVLRRAYQVAVAVEATKRNTLVIIPTGLGKTVVALLVMAHRVKNAPGKVLFLAPTKPLVEQHAQFLRDVWEDGEVAVFTGETAPADRELKWRQANVIVSTPQVVRNDVISERVSLDDVTLVVFDEAHRAQGNYAYTFIAERYHADRPDGLVLGMTASPGGNMDRIRDVCRALGIEGVEVRSEFDADVRPYVQDVNVTWKTVAVPESLKRIAGLLQEMLDQQMKRLRAAGAYHVPYVSKKELLAAAGRLQQKLQMGQGGPLVFGALSAQAAALKLLHAQELAETQGAGALENYLDRLAHDESKAAKAIIADGRMAVVRRLIRDRTAEHPKLRQVAVTLRKQLAENADARMIVFTNYRDTADLLVRELGKVEDLRPVKFVGQASRSDTDRGLTQKQQIETVQRFREGEFNVLVATSVAEEGLDIPSVDLVVFFEPVPSEIRAIQRRGRTGRKQAGKVVILVTKGTRDETYLHSSRQREKKMRKEIDALKQWFAAVNASENSEEWHGFFAPADGGQATLDVTGPTTDQEPARDRSTGNDASGNGGATATATLVSRAAPDAPDAPDAPPERAKRATVITDHREFAGAVTRELASLDVTVKPETLAVADYVLSDRVGVERKTAGDFVSSLLDGRLFQQVKALRDAFTVPLLVIEGGDLYTARRVNPDVIRGSLAALTADFRVTVITTKDAAETAGLLAAIAKREQVKEKRAVAVRQEKGTMSDDERVRFIVEGLPSVSAVLARRLLRHFGTVRAIVTASEEELTQVDGIGKKTAAEIQRVLTARYKDAPEGV